MTDQKIHDVFPYLRTHDGAAAIEFYAQAFGAKEIFRLSEPSGRVAHAELKIGTATMMVSDEYPEYGIQGPRAFGGCGSAVHLHVDDVDKMVDHAVSIGATVVMPPKDQFYGERVAKIKDPFGHEWLIGHSIEELSNEEIQSRYDEMMSGGAGE